MSECGDDCREIDQDVRGQGSDGGRCSSIGKRLRQGHVPKRAAIADVHAAERDVPIRALKEDRHTLARKGMKGVSDDERIKVATVRRGSMTGPWGSR